MQIVPVARLDLTIAMRTAVLLAAALPCHDPLFAQGSGTYPQTRSPARNPTSDASRENASGAAYPQPGDGQMQPIQAGQIIARVSNLVVLAGELLPQVNAMLKENADIVPPEKLPAIRRQLMQRQLEQLIETKLLYAEFRRTVPAENLPNIEKRLGEEFDRSQLPNLLKATKTKSRADLDTKLRQQGSSLAHQQRMFNERTIARQWLSQQINRDEEITHSEMLDYYREHLSDYHFPAKARWEEISVQFDRFATKEAAYRRLAELGNQVQRGAAFADVAKAHSHGLTADEGGRNDWTTQGSLVSTVIDKAIFHLPVGRLSQIVEDQGSFHIVRVVERKAKGTTPFLEAQEKIEAELRQEQVRTQVREYLVSLQRKHHVWTIFQDEPQQIGERAAGGWRR